MIVLGADTHKASHTVAAVAAAIGRLEADRTVRAKRRSFDDLLQWSRSLDAERVWAVEDCRHVSGALERFLLARGERVVRVAPRLMAGARKSSRERGKPDPIDAVVIARRDPRGARHAAGRAAGRRRTRRPTARRPSRAARRAAHRDDQRPALGAARPLARVRDPRTRVDPRLLAGARRRPPGARRADRA